MSAKSTKEASRLASALTGMSLAIGIAREATDAVPIVKQCLGAAVRIVAFAEKIDKDREALHELADRSLALVRRVKDVMTGRTPDTKIETSLERILKALESIETFMAKHSARSRLRRAFGYSFTVPQHVGRLSRELADAVQDLVVVALLDIDYQVHATHSAVEDNVRFADEFRLLRHCEVDKLEPLYEYAHQQDSTGLVVQYHRARVDGQLVVVRYCKGTECQDTRVVQTTGPTIFERLQSHDIILKELSTVQRSHRNVARIYGWGKGPIHDRFTVFKSGFRKLDSLNLAAGPQTLTTIMHWTFTVLVEKDRLRVSPLMQEQDAVHHLRQLGIMWNAAGSYMLDDHLEPTIGLWNDLQRVDPESNPMDEAEYQLPFLTAPLWRMSPFEEVTPEDFLAAFADYHHEQLKSLLSRFDAVRRRRYVILKAEFTERRVRNWEDDVPDVAWPSETWTWTSILLALDKTRGHRIKYGLNATYAPSCRSQDSLLVHGVEEHPERIVYDLYHFDIPDAERDEVRRMLDIPAPSTEEFITWHLIATGDPGAYRAPK